MRQILLILSSVFGLELVNNKAIYISANIYDKRDDLNFKLVNFPFLDGDVPHCLSNGVYISQLTRFARVCFNFDVFNNRNLFKTAK